MGREISSTDTMGTTTSNEFDPFGRIKKITVKQGEITDVVTREYDDNGTLIKEVEEDGSVYTYQYDKMNRLVKEGVEKDGLSKVWTTEYSYGSVDVHNGKGIDTINHVMITTEKNPDKEILETTYVDTLGHTIRQKKDGIYVDYTYDKDGSVVTSCQLGVDPKNEKPITTLYLYDKGGNNAGQILNPKYDETKKAFITTEDSLTQTMTYDSTGNVLTTTDGEGNTTAYTYDVQGRVTSVTEPSGKGVKGSVTTYKYDQFDTKNGNSMDIVTDALGRTSVITKNSLMQTLEVTDKGDGNIAAIGTKYSYDGKGRVAQEKDSLGGTRTYEYDGKDRVTAVHYKNPSGTEEQRTCYTYDKADQVRIMLDYRMNGATPVLYRYTEFKYDRLKRMTGLIELNTSKEPSAIAAEEKERATTMYRYDIDGNLLSVKYPKSDWKIVELSYNYDKNKWLKSIEAVWEDGTKAILREYEYDEYGDVKNIRDYRSISGKGVKIEQPEYTTCSYTYDVCRRPASMTYVDSNAPDMVKEAYTYEYDKNSRLVRETLQNLYPEKEEERQDEIRTYTYDTGNRLVRTKVENRRNAAASYETSYTYDAVGNRLTETTSTNNQTETTKYTYNSLNQLTNGETKKSDGTQVARKEYKYDANGNQIQEIENVEKKEIVNIYDAAGRLAVTTKKEQGKVTLEQNNLYNGSGARIKKTENGAETNYFYSQGGVLYTTDKSGKGTSLNLQGISGNIIATGRKEKEGEGYYYYHKDPAGSITNLRNAEGKSVVSYQYTDFGETSIYGDKDFYNEICYNETIYDKNTGLYYLSARYYNPEDGRFISRDSYRGDSMNPNTLHLYSYCANNPVNYEDPDGHVAISRIIGGIVGGVAGGLIGRKIAKKTKAKGWKKVAIIAGCAVGGAVVGAIVGPRVAKAAKKVTKIVKKASKVVKRKLPSRTRILKTTKRTLSKGKKSVIRQASKAKQAISKGKVKKTVKSMAKRVVKRTTKEAGKGAVKGAIQNKLAGKDVRKGAISGAVNGAVASMSQGITEVKDLSILKRISAKVGGSVLGGYLGNRSVGDSYNLRNMFFGVAQGVIGYGFDNLNQINTVTNIIGKSMQSWAQEVPDMTLGFIDAL